MSSGGRRPLVIANWKMNLRLAEARVYLGTLAGRDHAGAVEVWIAPPLVHIASLAEAAARAGVGLAAQNCHAAPSGSFTGEVAAEQVADAGAMAAIVGHSERRQLFGEDDAAVRDKVQASWRAGLTAVLCIGETLAEREAGRTEERLARQLEGALGGQVIAGPLVIAYEPVWAIGTGKVASPEQAQGACSQVRRALGRRVSEDLAAATRILYGGSVTAGNATATLRGRDVDGALVGGASLAAESFLAIIAAVRRER